MQQGAVSQAERQFIKALEFEPANAEYHFELANVYASRYDAWKALPNHPETQMWLEKAAGELEQAVMFQPDFEAALFNLGVVYKKMGQHEKARELFKKVLILNDKNAAAHMQIAATYEEQGFYDDAKDAYERARELDYFNPAIQTSLENVDILKDEDRERQNSAAMHDRYMRMAGLFEHSPGSVAAQHMRDAQLQRQNGQNMATAIPYLASYLIQQFMERRTLKKIEEV